MAKIEIDAAGIERVEAKLSQIQRGDLAVRVPTDVGDPAVNKCLASVNHVVEVLEQRTQEAHASSMDLALGISDCFEALSQVRAGNLEARVSDATLNADDELLGKFASVLNDTLADLQLTIQRQHFAIQTLSTPILNVWDDILALPVIGVVDTQRSADIMEKLLTAIVEQQARYVILDITGVEVVDTKTADHFIKVINSAQLLGAKCVLTGIQPAVAQTLVDIGIDMSSVTTLSNLQEGLRHCLRRLEARRARAALAPSAE